ncbi:hypothetical protein MHJ_0692 [Mesomycoplasma hyopneumoniae J]|uniref:YggT family protein n=1 Tax=Mesomycoplasma hyopneumoniae (strain J / ATCC 25934 / NCTC 10110) TaxID=262719 RepID=A4Q7T9_MESHJ|nr:hypothetical protein MHJ_0692 [Mesomycoplasma hyopneumoniae J]
MQIVLEAIAFCGLFWACFSVILGALLVFFFFFFFVVPWVMKLPPVIGLCTDTWLLSPSECSDFVFVYLFCFLLIAFYVFLCWERIP